VDKKYDYEGRLAIQSLPTPVLQSNLQYRGDILINSSTSKPYVAGDFDKIGCSSPDSVAPLGATAQANIYYSGLNPDKSGMQRYVPDAKGYPFIQTMYSPDNTNRVNWQGGAGYDFQTWKNHAVHNDYVRALQPELDYMMGVDAGLYEYYPKQIVTDQNGQHSFTIFNPQGKIIASGLQGIHPDTSISPIDTLPDYFGGQQVCYDLLSTLDQNKLSNGTSVATTFFTDRDGTNQLQYSVSIPAFYTGCSGLYLQPKAHYNYSVFSDCGVQMMTADQVIGRDTIVTSNTPLYTKPTASSVSLLSAKYGLTKQITFSQYDLDSLAQIFVLKQSTPPQTCFSNANNFIYNSVTATVFPCKDTGGTSLCEQRVNQMKSELYPMAKYGNFTRSYYTGAFGYCDDTNSIFTLIDSAGFVDPCTYNTANFPASGSGSSGFYTISTPPSTVTNTGFGGQGNVVGGPPANPGGGSGPGSPCFPSDIRRYQQTCLTFRTDTINGRIFTDANFKSMPVDTFILYFNDKRADDLLPLHPEYCKLALCDNGNFDNTLNSLQTYQQATAAGMFALNDIVTKDPLYAYAAAQIPSTATSISNKLSYFSATTQKLDNFSIAEAYCNGGGADEAYQCVVNLYASKISAMSFVDNTVEQQYFTLLKANYIANRTLVMQQMMDGIGNSCTPCSQSRMHVTGTAVFPTVFNASGNMDTSLHLPSWMATAFNNATSGNTNALKTVPAGLTDSMAIDNTFISNGMVDNIMTSLMNCAVDTSTLNPIRVQLLTQVANGVTLTPAVVKAAIISGGFTLSDLCHPFLASYSIYSQGQSSSPAYACGLSGMYIGLTQFLNISNVRTAIAQASSSHTGYTVSLSTTNLYENAISVALGGATSITVQGYTETVVDSLANINTVRLDLTAGSTTISLYVDKKPGGTDLNTVTTLDSFSGAGCINADPAANTNGYIAQGTATINAYYNGGATAGAYYVWSKSISIMPIATNSSIANSITCYDMVQALTSFKSDKTSYGYDEAYNHPLFEATLTNYMNYYFNKQFVYDDYYQLMTGCAVTDQVPLKNHTATYEMEFANDTDANVFLRMSNGLGSGHAVNCFRYSNASGHIVLFLDLNSLPKDSLVVYKALMNGSLTTYTYNCYARNYLYDAPDSNLIFADSTLSSVNFNGYSTATNTISFIYNTGISNYYTCAYYVFSSNTGSSVPLQTQNLATIDSELQRSGIAYHSFYNRQYLRSSDYYTPIKQQYLTYAYGLTGDTHDQAVAALSPGAVGTLSNFSGKTVTYNDPLCTVRKTDLYAYNWHQTSFAGYTLLNTILGDVSGSGYLFPAANNNTSNPRVYEKANGNYWYLFFDTNHNMYNVYIAPPPTLSVPQSQLQLDSVTLNGGKDSIYSFTAYMHASSLPGTAIACPGYTSFAIGYSQKLAHVILADQPGVNTCFDTLDCERSLLNNAVANAEMAYREYFDSVTGAMSDSMMHFLVNNTVDTLQLCYQDQKYHFTLYYYDRAGNLERTVPPAGVHLLSLPAATVDESRNIGYYNSSTVPAHTKVSYYQYNAQNQLIYQNTPDGGVATFYYDAAGKQVFSQNARQANSGTFSYTLYDKQERPVETGEAQLGTSTSTPAYIYQCNVPSIDPMDTIAKYVREHGRNDVIVTTYDTMIKSLNAIAGQTLTDQTNLRKRVSAVRYFNSLNAQFPASGYTYPFQPAFGTYFSYDMTGNVQTIVYDFPTLQPTGQEYKRIDYDYDLLSGKINMLSYNRGHGDQFYHQYTYDADNRITNVATSNDAITWNTDARYNYYHHGPLAQVQVGDQMLQSMEYAYTIQGWLKAINGDVLGPTNDMGNNGASGDVTYARDAMAHALHYFANDYKSIDTTAHVTHVAEPTKNLYNGNIVRQNTDLTGLADMQRNYRYDQLQRLKLVNNDQVNDATLAVTPSQLYRSAYTYDPDGNITKLSRWGSTSVYDSLLYNYTSGGANNQLQSVQNQVSGTGSTLGTQNWNNYQYDSTGRLTVDQAGNINMKWTPYDKLRNVTNSVTGYTTSYTYDGQGNRVYKETVEKQTGGAELHDGEYYVHDATGNILAVYHRLGHFALVPIIANFNGGIVVGNGTGGNPGPGLGTGGLSHFINGTIAAQSGFTGGFVSNAATNSLTWTTGQTSAHPTSFYITNSSSVLPGLLSSGTAYLTPVRTYQATIYTNALNVGIRGLKLEPGYLVGDVLADSAATIEFLQNFEQIMTQPVAATVWSQCDLTTTGNFHADAVSLQSSMVSLGRLSQVQGQVITVLQADHTGHAQTAAGVMINDDAIFLSANLRSSKTKPRITNFETDLTKVLNNEGDRTALGGFFDQYGPATSLLTAENPPSQLLGIVYNVAPDSTLANFINNVGEAPVDTLIAAQPMVNSVSYPALVQGFVGGVQTNQNPLLALGDVTDTVELAEHDIYGSSRLGAQRYDTGVYLNTMSMDTSKHPVTTITNAKPWYSSAQGCLMDRAQKDPYSNATDWSTDTLFRFIGRRYYNLTDHLGSVLATIVDRKTGHLPSGALSYDYWNPDLATVSDYYPGGLLARSLQAGDSSWYRYSYNGKQKDNEMYGVGNFLNYGDRGLDTRLIKWIIRDNLANKYPSISPYVYVADNPILFVDHGGQKINIYYQDENGKNTSYEYGSKVPIPNNTFVQNTVASLDRDRIVNKNTEGAVNRISSDQQKTLDITESNKGVFQLGAVIPIKDMSGDLIKEGSTVDPSKVMADIATIAYNPYAGLSNNDGTEAISPATALIHEITHVYSAFYQTAYFLNSKSTYDAAFQNAQENFATTFLEHAVASYYGEWNRTDHTSGKEIVTTSPLSNAPVVTQESELGQGEAVDVN